ncbi:MAG TPA: M28 family peptidase, partial [Longimicrobium sp.]|uniref:M28 family peptidase n=1 Tax=Longimicrobium sp. TaxID=2029185 RepID=UPI002ED95EED
SIAGIFRRAGLRPAGDSGSYLQRFTFAAVDVPAAERRFTMDAGGRQTAWTYGADYFSFAAQTAAEGEAVYVGPALPQPSELGEGARGRIAVFHLGGSPVDGVGAMTGAVVSAMRAGSSGVLLVLDPAIDADSVEWFAHQMEGANPTAPLPVFGIRTEVAQSVFRAGGQDDAALRARSATLPLPLPGVRISMAAPARPVQVSAPNVVAVLPGSDPVLRDQYVVLTAHFDHVGVAHGADGDSIYNGADDNASGTAALLAAAEAFGRLRRAPARSVVFLAVSAEERNLQGSQYWVAHPSVPRERIVANINLDMVGRNAPDTLTVLGQEYSSLGELVARVNAAHPELRFHLQSQVDPALRWFGRSDQASFVAAGVPALFFSTMQHPDYHRVTDSPANLNTEKLARVARLLFYTAHAAASDPARPAWLPGGQARARAAIQ